MIRVDHADFVYMSTDEKYEAIVADIKKTNASAQPILVGTTSIETSEYLSRLLKKEGVPHQILNAKFHEKEAQIVAEAGRPGAVTIATNMAGRGTDIVLGGNLEAELKMLDAPTEEEIASRTHAWEMRHAQVVASGGLYVLGTERHESRRIDNQLRGRSGRQGDPGKSRFYLSLQDNLLRIFGGDRLNAIMQRIGMEKGASLESRLLSRSIENAQRKVEAYNFDVRKQLLEYDDVANEQRKVIYKQRDELLGSESISETIVEIGQRVMDQVIDIHVPPNSMEEEWDVPGLQQQLETGFNLKLPLDQWLLQDTAMDEERLRAQIQAAFIEAYQNKSVHMGAPVMRQFEKAVMLQMLDTAWREHLAAMDYLRQGIHLRGYAQKNPKQEYKREAFQLFVQLLDRVNYDVISALSKFEVKLEHDVEQMEAQRRHSINTMHMEYQHAEMHALQVPVAAGDAGEAAPPRPSPMPLEAAQTFVRHAPKVGRNEPCSCGSGKKYKQCHGKLD
jgi:preprotein translocase subunit SecA